MTGLMAMADITAAMATGPITAGLITASGPMADTDMDTAGAMTGGTDIGTGIDGGDQIKPPSGYSKISINSAAFRWA